MSDPPLSPEFDRYAADYDAALERGLSVSGEDKDWFARERLLHLARRLAQLGLRAERALDFGCGTGSAAPFALEAFPDLRQWTGIDVSAQSLDVARRLHGGDRVEFRLMSEHAPRADLDLAFCNGVFHHIAPERRAATVREIRAGLRPGGLFALFENNPWNPGTRYVMSRIPFDRDAVTLSAPAARRLVAAGGFELLRTDFLFVFPRTLRWLRPLERSMQKLPLGAQYLVLGRKPVSAA
jgi:SAM-dependent methyltransferase